MLKKKKFVEILFLFERQKHLCWRPLYQNPKNYMFIKTVDEITRKLPPNNTKCIKKYIFLLKMTMLQCVFTRINPIKNN